jgi:hypothetical protein
MFVMLVQVAPASGLRRISCSSPDMTKTVCGLTWEAAIHSDATETFSGVFARLNVGGV